MAIVPSAPVSDKWAVVRTTDGGLVIQFLAPDGRLKADIRFDADAAREFIDALEAEISRG